MSHTSLRAGAARRVITPPVGALLTGWNPRATGDTRSRYVHDDLYVKALALETAGSAWMMIAADLTGIDAIATERIRRGVSEQTGLPPDAILVCATHTHSGPAVAPVISLCEISKHRFDGKNWPTITADDVTVWWADAIDPRWKERFIALSIEAGGEAWRSMKPAEIAFSESKVEGVGSSRRVRMSDGSWGDPRREAKPDIRAISRTAIDPAVRVMWIRHRTDQTPISAVINYGSHPWLFFGSGISAELAGATSAAVAAHWRAPGAEPPIVLYTTGPEGDVTLIWNLDIQNLWRAHPGETDEDSLARRQRVFDTELARLSGRLTAGIIRALADARQWDAAPRLCSQREVVALPVKDRYRPPPQALLADWQKSPPAGCLLTEVQVLQAGKGAFAGLPGEPFSSLGSAIRKMSPVAYLTIAALANDFGVVTYIAEHESFDLGGYEVELSPLAAGAGETLVEHAADLLKRTVGGEPQASVAPAEQPRATQPDESPADSESVTL